MTNDEGCGLARMNSMYVYIHTGDAHKLINVSEILLCCTSIIIYTNTNNLTIRTTNNNPCNEGEWLCQNECTHIHTNNCWNLIFIACRVILMIAFHEV